MTAAGLSPVSKLFADLCQIQSPSLKEGLVAAFVKSFLDNLGVEWEEDSAAEALKGECGNIICRVGGADQSASILVCAHLDTVPPGLTTNPVLKGGQWSNSGDGILGADNKAAIAAILSSLEHWAAHPPEVNVVAVFTVAEEISLRGAGVLDLDALGADAAFTFDHPTPIGTVVTGSPSHHTVEIEFSGTAAHAGVAPEDGASAIAAAATALELCPSGRIDDVTTANFGLIEGGSAINVVPERCSVLAEVRSLDAASLTDQTRLIIEAAHEGAGKHGCGADVTVRPTFRGYAHSDDHSALLIGEAALRSIGVEPQRIASAGGSDVNVFENSGLPSLNLGDGSWGTHTDEEGIADKDLAVLADLVMALPAAAASAF